MVPTDVKAGANVGSKNGSESVREPAFMVGLNLLLVLLHQPEGDLHSGWVNFFFLPLMLFDRVTDTAKA